MLGRAMDIESRAEFAKRALHLLRFLATGREVAECMPGMGCSFLVSTSELGVLEQFPTI
jgi:hypothetical protein